MNSARNWVFSTGWWFGTFFMFPYFGKNNRRKFRSQTSDNMDRWKAEQGRGREKRKIRRKKSQKRQDQKKEEVDARKGRKVAIHCVFPMICGSGGSKSRLAKAAGAEPAGQMSDEKLHAVVARSAFRSQNVQNTPVSDHFWKLRCRKSARGSDHFWKLRCRKSARRCGAKHISKSKCTKHHMFAPLLEVRMLKKCTPLWREAHFEVKMYKTSHVCATFGGSDVEKVHAVVARSTFRSEHVQNTRGSDHFWRFRCRFAASLHYTTLRYITPHSTILHYITLHYTTLHNTTTTTTQLDYTPLHSTTLNFTTLHYTTLRSTTLHYIKLHYTPLHYITLHYAPQHYNYNYTTTLHYTPLH